MVALWTLEILVLNVTFDLAVSEELFSVKITVLVSLPQREVKGMLGNGFPGCLKAWASILLVATWRAARPRCLSEAPSPWPDHSQQVALAPLCPHWLFLLSVTDLCPTLQSHYLPQGSLTDLPSCDLMVTLSGLLLQTHKST